MNELAIQVFLVLRECLPLEIGVVATDLAQAEVVQSDGILVHQLVRPVVILRVPEHLLKIIAQLQRIIHIVLLLESLENHFETHWVLDLPQVRLLGRRVVLLPKLMRKESILVLVLDLLHDVLDILHALLRSAVRAAILKSGLRRFAERRLLLALDQLFLHGIIPEDQVAL